MKKGRILVQPKNLKVFHSLLQVPSGLFSAFQVPLGHVATTQGQGDRKDSSKAMKSEVLHL